MIRQMKSKVDQTTSEGSITTLHLLSVREKFLRMAPKNSVRLGTGSEQNSRQSQVQQVPEAQEDGQGEHCLLAPSPCKVEVSKEQLEQQAEDGPEQHAEAETGKSNLYTSAASVLPTAPQLSITEIRWI